MDILEHLGMLVPDIEGHGVITGRANEPRKYPSAFRRWDTYAAHKYPSMRQLLPINKVLHWCCPSEVSQWLKGTKPPQTRDTVVTRRYGWPLTAHREKLDKVDVIFIYCMGNNVLCSIHTASSEFSSTAGLMWNLKCLWLLSRSKCSYFFKLILRRGAAARKRRQEV